MLAPSMCFRIEEALAEEHFLNQLEVFFGQQTIPQAQEATLRHYGNSKYYKTLGK
jgi:hypothetical protein